MRRRGLDITLAFYQRGVGGYTSDPADDFASAGRLLDMSQHHGQDALAELDQTVEERQIGLGLHVLGAAGARWRYWRELGTYQYSIFAELPATQLPVTRALAPGVISVPFHESVKHGQLTPVAACFD